MKIIATTSNGVESSFTEEQWAKVKSDKRYKNTFTIIKQVTEPIEVSEAKAKVSAPSEPTAKADKK